MELGLAPYFSQQMLGRNELMASQNALNYLELSAVHKDELEVYFDISAILSQLGAAGQQVQSEYEVEEAELNSQVTDLFRSVLPDIDELSTLLREEFLLNVTEDNELEVDIQDILNDSLNLSAVDVPLPPLVEAAALEQVLPFVDLTQIQGANVTLPDVGPLGQNVTLLDLLEGTATVNLGELLETLQDGNLTTVKVPLAPLLEQMINSTGDIDLALAHNFTIVEGFDAPAGKFPTTLGDAVLMDCRSAKNMLFNSYLRVFDEIVKA